MKRAFQRLMRVLAVAALLTALINPAIATRGGPRTRVYVLDVSGSMQAKGAPESLDLRDIRRLAEFDARRAPGEPSPLLLAASSAVRSDFSAAAPRLDEDATDLDGALEAAVALAGEGDIVLFSDGRAKVDRSLLRGVPIHVVPAGPIDPVDVRIAAVSIPPSVRPGATCAARVTLASTGAIKGRLLGRDFVFEGAASQDLLFDLNGDGELRLEVDDACDRNNHVALRVLERDESPRVLVLSATDLGIPGAREGDPGRFDVIVVNNVPLSDELNRRIASSARAGAGLILLGGSNSYARGGWAGTPLEEVSPLWAFPDDRVALVVVFDRSGSMNNEIPGTRRRRIEAAAAAVSDALSIVKDDDEIAAVPFSGDPDVIPLRPGAKRGDLAESLRRVTPGGPTRLKPALERALAVLDGATAAKKRILLLTDGETEESEADLRAIGERLAAARVGLVVVGTNGPQEKLALLGAPCHWIEDLSKMSLEADVARARDLELEPGTVDAGWPLPRRINRTSAKPAAEIVARADGAPLVARQGRTIAATFALEEGWAGGFAAWRGLPALVAQVTPPASGAAWITIEGAELVVCASKEGSAVVGDRPLALVKRGIATWEGRIRVSPGTHVVRFDGRPVASAVVPCAEEYVALGVDFAALDRIAGATGGRRVGRLEELPPRRASTTRVPLRPWLLAAALLLFLLDIAAATFWR